MIKLRPCKPSRHLVKRLQSTKTVPEHQQFIPAEQIVATSTSSGKGPFIEIPVVEPLAKCSSMLLKLPSSSKFYSKLANVTLVSGKNSTGLNTIDVSKYNEQFFQLKTQLDSGNAILSTPPNSTLEAITIKNENSSGWSVIDAKKNVAGFSEHLKITKTGTNDSRVSSICGWGVFLLMGENLKTIELHPEQHFVIPPSDLIAFENGTGLSFSTESIFSSPTLLSKLFSSYNGVASKLRASQQFYKVKGPGKIIIKA
ncbi:hypothetical protein ACO0QE_000528 [Hanseniaspora vineae]